MPLPAGVQHWPNPVILVGGRVQSANTYCKLNRKLVCPQELLKKCRFRQGSDALVLVGDLVNKGPDSAGVVATARRLGALSVRGNHDDAALAAYYEHRHGKKVKVRTCIKCSDGAGQPR